MTSEPGWTREQFLRGARSQNWMNVFPVWRTHVTFEIDENLLASVFLKKKLNLTLVIQVMERNRTPSVKVKENDVDLWPFILLICMLLKCQDKLALAGSYTVS